MPDIVPKLKKINKFQNIDEQVNKEQQRNDELMKKKQLNDLKEENAELEKEVNGDINVATSEVSELVSENVDPLGANINKNDYVASGTLSAHELHKSWFEKNGEYVIGGIFVLVFLLIIFRRKN